MQQRSAALFPGASNINFNSSSFVVNANNNQTNGRLDRLFEVAAPNAILNAGGRADEVRCYPGTREEVINGTEKWMDGEGPRASQMIMWLNGPAGAGKSAIMQTVAERCQKHGRHAVNFFFFRGDETRNHAQSLIATLVYQLRALYPALDKPIEDCLAAMSLITKASIGEQFDQLISSPIRIIRNSSPIDQPIILIVDGLDECDDKQKQEQILVALHTLVEKDSSLFRVLVASRAESHIVMAFNKIGSLAVSIFLDDKYRPQDDIRRFVIAKFDEMKKTHRLAHTLNKYWPAAADIDAIVGKSSGQFIYAATVIRFIQYSTASPRLSLQTVHGIRPAAEHSPYAQLDAVYSYVLSKSQNIQAMNFCLGVYFVLTSPRNKGDLQHINFRAFLHYTGYEPIEIESLFADIVAIASVHTTPYLRLAFYHASLSDYLLDKSRSGIHHVDLHRIATEILTISLGKKFHPMSWYAVVWILEFVEEATPALSKWLLEASNGDFAGNRSDYTINDAWQQLMVHVYQLYFASDPALYRRLLRRWICFAYINHIHKFTTEKLVATAATPDKMRSDIHKYYNWYLRTEGLKHAFRRKFQNTN